MRPIERPPSIECVAYAPTSGPRYSALSVRFNIEVVSDCSLMEAQQRLESSIKELGPNLDQSAAKRHFLESLALRGMATLSSLFSLVKPIEHAHWKYRPNTPQ